MNQQMDGDDMQWFRWWNDGIDDEKLLQMTYQHRWLWLVILTLANLSPHRGKLYVSESLPFGLEGIIRKAHLPPKIVETGMNLFESAAYAMLSRDEKMAWVVTNWGKRQPARDDTAHYTSAHRKRVGNAECNALGNAVVMPPDTETDTDIKHTSIVSLWNEICSSKLPSVTSLTPTRQKHLKARLATKGRDLAWWRSYFTRIVGTPFLTGKSAKEWKANFDFAIRSEDVVAKILEGQYGEVLEKRTAPQAVNKPLSEADELIWRAIHDQTLQ